MIPVYCYKLPSKPKDSGDKEKKNKQFPPKAVMQLSDSYEVSLKWFNVLVIPYIIALKTNPLILKVHVPIDNLTNLTSLFDTHVFCVHICQ